MNSKNAKNCEHALLVSDSKVIEFIRNTIITNDVSYNQKYQKYVDSLSVDYLEIITTECP